MEAEYGGPQPQVKEGLQPSEATRTRKVVGQLDFGFLASRTGREHICVI